MSLFVLVSLEVVILVSCLLGGVFGQHAWVAYGLIFVLTSPVWAGVIFLVIAWVVDWFDQRARAKRIARCKAARAAREAALG
ncbi:hypothetical protein ACSZOA_13710 [Aeromonas caviae]